MQLSHALKHENKVNALFTSFCTFSRLFVLGFIRSNATVFEGLTRNTTPFGGNWLPQNEYVISSPYVINRSLSDKQNTMTALEKRLLSLQQQVQQLNIDLSTLITLASSSQSDTNKVNAINQLADLKTELTKKPGIGIHRYRQLQSVEQADPTNDHPARHLARSRQK